MTFDETPELQAAVAEARHVRDTLISPAAAEIDRSTTIPQTVLDAARRVTDWSRSPLHAVLALEELATASGAVAAAVAVGKTCEGGLSGLRGVPRVETPSEPQRLGLAAVCLGLGRTALDSAIDLMKGRGDRPSGDPGEAPHWVLSDAATELQAARLLVHAAAQGAAPGPAAVLVFASAAASRAVDAAVRIVGPDALSPGSALERCLRDVRAATLLLGGEDRTRLAAADSLLG